MDSLYSLHTMAEINSRKLRKRKQIIRWKKYIINEIITEFYEKLWL